MSYSLSIPDVARDVEFEDLRDRVRETMDAVGYTEENAATGVRDRILGSVDVAMHAAEVLQLEGDVFNVNLSGHVKQSDEDLAGDLATITITAKRKVVE